MVKKVLACLLLVVLWSSCAFGELSLFTSHRSIVDFVDGKPDYSTARFLAFWVHAVSDNLATQEDLNLTGSMSFSGGNYSFWDSKNGMRKISDTPYTFGLASTSGVGGELGYEPFTASGDVIAFCLSADGGLNSVDVSWNFPGNASYNGQGTIPNYRTTQEQLESYVPYVEYISSGTQVTGLRWRMVSPDKTSEAVTLDFASGFIVSEIWNASGNNLYSGEWATIETGNPVSGEVTFDTPINEADISRIRVAFNYRDGNSDNSYQWHFCKPSTPEPRLFENHTFTASLVNGKSDYSNAKFDSLFFDIQADNVTAEAHHFTTEGSVTIPGGGYSLADDNTGEGIGVTIPAGTDKTFNLRMYRDVIPSDLGLTYQPIDENGTNLQFEEAENLAGRTLTWTFPTEPNLSGSAAISSFKSTSEQLAEGVPYIELVSADGKLTAVNFRMVTSSDTSTALTLPYRTNFRLRFRKSVPDTTGKFYWSDWMYNTSSGTWTLGNPQDLSNMRGISIRYWSWENPDKAILYQWYFAAESSSSTLDITTATLPDATLNASYTATLAANLTGATWSVISGSLPTGLTLNASTGAITGTPTAAGTSTFTVRAVKDSQSAEKQLTLTVSPIPTITITTTSLPNGTRNTSYSETLTASITGANWSVVSGNLPTGLTLSSSTGAITGTPTTAGTYTFTVRATYSTASDEKQFTITIAESSVTTLTITTASLNSGRTGQSYSETLSANMSGVTWSVISGNLPAGLTLNQSTGVISGIPTTAGTYTFTVRAVSSSQSAEKSFSITVTQAGITIGGSSSSGCESGLALSSLLLLAMFIKKR